MRKEKKPINNGLKNPSLAYQKLGRLKMNNKQVRRKKIGQKEGNTDMAGNKIK